MKSLIKQMLDLKWSSAEVCELGMPLSGSYRECSDLWQDPER